MPEKWEAYRLSTVDGGRAPSGTQVQLTHGNQRATVVEVGGALRSYVAGGRPLFDGYGLDERCSGARGQTLIPWPNRLRDGAYSFDGRDHQLALSEPARHNAIHGLVRWANWSVVEQDEHRVAMAYTLHPQSGWPFTLDLQIDYRLGSEGLSVRTTATNTGTSHCPYGAGAHPYLTLGTPTIDQLRLQAPGAHWLPTDERGIPMSLEPVAGTNYDFRASRLIGTTVLDTSYTNLDRDEAGLAHIELVEERTASTVRLWMDDTYQYLMLFTGDSLPDQLRRRRGLGVEPMTCAPNALQSGTGLRTLKPGETLASNWGISPTPRAARLGE
jgi:aldose 1-epimerase